MSLFEKARKFVYQNARPLDIFRFQYLFENGSSVNVLKALKMYQNPDGGFAYGLEPDCWNVNSSPLQTWVATRIIEEVGLTDDNFELFNSIIKYLCSLSEFNNGYWNGLNQVKSNNEYPHAPWWHYEKDAINSYSPTASLAGFILKYSIKQSNAYIFALNITKEAYKYFEEKVSIDSMHEALCFVELYEYLKASNITDIVDMKEFKKRLS